MSWDLSYTLNVFEFAFSGTVNGDRLKYFHHNARVTLPSFIEIEKIMNNFLYKCNFSKRRSQYTMVLIT